MLLLLLLVSRSRGGGGGERGLPEVALEGERRLAAGLGVGGWKGRGGGGWRTGKVKQEKRASILAGWMANPSIKQGRTKEEQGARILH